MRPRSSACEPRARASLGPRVLRLVVVADESFSCGQGEVRGAEDPDDTSTLYRADEQYCSSMVPRRPGLATAHAHSHRCCCSRTTLALLHACTRRRAAKWRGSLAAERRGVAGFFLRIPKAPHARYRGLFSRQGNAVFVAWARRYRRASSVRAYGCFVGPSLLDLLLVDKEDTFTTAGGFTHLQMRDTIAAAALVVLLLVSQPARAQQNSTASSPLYRWPSVLGDCNARGGSL